MNILKISYLAIALCSAGLTFTACSDRTYEKTIDADTITWKQIDPSVRKFCLHMTADLIELMADPDMQKKMAQNPMHAVSSMLEKAIDTDYSDLSDEYADYNDALKPIQRKMIDDIKELTAIPLPQNSDELMSYEQKITDSMLDIRKKHQADIDAINLRHPNAAILFDSPIGEETLLLKLLKKEINLENMMMQEVIATQDVQQASKNVAKKLRELADKQ